MKNKQDRKAGGCVTGDTGDRENKSFEKSKTS